MLATSKSRVEHFKAKQDAIEKLHSLQKHGGEDGSNVHVNADIVLCDFLEAIGDGEVAREFRKIHKIYPTVTPRYSKPSWRL